MGLLRRLFDPAYRRARTLEADGAYRMAAEGYASAGAFEEATRAVLALAVESVDADERARAFEDALRWMPADHPRRGEVEGRLEGIAFAAARGRAQADGARGLDSADRTRLARLARRFEDAGRAAEAAEAFELLGDREGLLRCLAAAGEVERLERLLEGETDREDFERRIAALVDAHRLALVVGARREALAAIVEAEAVARRWVQTNASARAAENPFDPLESAPTAGQAAVAELAAIRERLRLRFPAPYRLQLALRFDGNVSVPKPVAAGGMAASAGGAAARLVCVGRDDMVLGRVGADLDLRGASVSRRHARLVLRGNGFVVEDLGSRNGTWVAGVPITGAVALEGGTDLGLGEDVTVRIERHGAGARAVVVRGLDCGLVAWVGTAPMALVNGLASITFPDGHATLRGAEGVTVTLEGQRCVAPIELLKDDHLEVLAGVSDKDRRGPGGEVVARAPELARIEVIA